MGFLYLIVNNINGKCYVGQTRNLKNRNHFKKASCKTDPEYDSVLHKAIRKYEEYNFTQYVFEVPDSFMDEGEKIFIAK